MKNLLLIVWTVLIVYLIVICTQGASVVTLREYNIQRTVQQGESLDISFLNESTDSIDLTSSSQGLYLMKFDNEMKIYPGPAEGNEYKATGKITAGQLKIVTAERPVDLVFHSASPMVIDVHFSMTMIIFLGFLFSIVGFLIWIVGICIAIE